MLPDRKFRNLDKKFWANVRSISQTLGYTDRKTKQIRVYSLGEMQEAMSRLGLSSSHLVTENGLATSLGSLLLDYSSYRAESLNHFVQPHLMDAARAKKEFSQLKKQLKPKRSVPMNKQSGDKKTPAYLTGTVNMLIEANCGGLTCDYNPLTLTTITHNDEPVRTLARRVDGCFTSTVNPIAIWEIKEYYYTTTFGSRVADGVYESLLDGLELEELREHEGVDVKHLLIIDGRYTWWDLGRSYLCRLIDILNMGYVDEILFGYEVIERLPAIVREWVKTAQQR